MAAGIEVPGCNHCRCMTARCNCDCGCVQCAVARGEDGQYESYEIWLAPKDILATWQALLSAGATPVGCEALEMQRIAAGIPLYGVDIRERDLPQETEQMRALNFNKGCYVGQEIVERIRSRGNVHRKFTGFVLEGSADITADAKIVLGEKEVGEVTSVALLRFPSGERKVALGYIRREAGTPGRGGHDRWGQSNCRSVAAGSRCHGTGAGIVAATLRRVLNAEIVEFTRRTRRRLSNLDDAART